MPKSFRLFALFSFFVMRGAVTPTQTWKHLGPEGGTVLSLAAAPDGEVYLGASDGLVQQLLVDFRSPPRLWAAVWYPDPGAGGGVFRGDDGGRHGTPGGHFPRVPSAAYRDHSRFGKPLCSL